MRNAEMARLEGLVGQWTTTLSGASFLEPPGAELSGTTSAGWLGESLLVVRTAFLGDRHVHSEFTLVLGRSDANDRFVALYQDERGVCREFLMTFAAGHWTLTREDPDFHQRFVADVRPDRIDGRWEASDDLGRSWQQDYELTFVRS